MDEQSNETHDDAGSLTTFPCPVCGCQHRLCLLGAYFLVRFFPESIAEKVENEISEIEVIQ